MNESDLTKLFLDYAESLRASAEIKAKIEIEVLERGKTVKIVGISATYYAPSYGTPDYKGVAEASMPKGFDIVPFSTMTLATRWKEICQHLALVIPDGILKPARVVVSG